MRHRGIDSAATLAFFSALAIFPAALTVISALALGQGQKKSAETILTIAGEILQADTIDVLRQPVTQLFSIGNPGIALVVGIWLSIWSMSSYATAFGRAANSVYEVQEGRRILKFRGLMLLLSVFLVIAFAAVFVLLLTTQAVAGAIGETMGVGEPWVSAWAIARWPVLLLVLTLIIAILYYFTPNVRHERMRWISVGASFAIVAWALATAGFALYVSTVANYDRIYGWLGGALVLLVWLYISNLALVAGLEVDAEFTRLRQLVAGIDADELVKLPMRDSTRNLILARRRASDSALGKEIREESASSRE